MRGAIAYCQEPDPPQLLPLPDGPARQEEPHRHTTTTRDKISDIDKINSRLSCSFFLLGSRPLMRSWCPGPVCARGLFFTRKKWAADGQRGEKGDINK